MENPLLFFLSFFLFFVLLEGGVSFGNDALLAREREWMERKERLEMKKEAREEKTNEESPPLMSLEPVEIHPFKGFFLLFVFCFYFCLLFVLVFSEPPQKKEFRKTIQSKA